MRTLYETRPAEEAEGMQPRISGTKEWSVASANFLIGCSHRCGYCYARQNATERYGYVRAEDWSTPRLRPDQLRKKWPKVDGTIMFPSTHDILPEFLKESIVFLGNLLRPGNRVLVVSKPHLACIKKICSTFQSARDRILFRFTIGADDVGLLSYWEPGAPGFGERLESLQRARAEGYRTSVSLEPMLDTRNIGRLVQVLLPHVTDTIWLGLMNNTRDRVKVENEEDRRQLARVLEGQTPAGVREIYQALKDLPAIRWKESIKQIVGLPLAPAPGQDI